MSGTSESKSPRIGATPVSWGIWAERSVVRALELDPESYIVEGLLCGQPVSQVALAIARAVGYLSGTQRAPDLCAPIRAWIDRVAMVFGDPKDSRLGGLSWGEWAERASVVALEIDPEQRVDSMLLHGQFVWELAILIARTIACLAGVRRMSILPEEVRDWLQQSIRACASGRGNEDNLTEETSR